MSPLVAAGARTRHPTPPTSIAKDRLAERGGPGAPRTGAILAAVTTCSDRGGAGRPGPGVRLCWLVLAVAMTALGCQVQYDEVVQERASLPGSEAAASSLGAGSDSPDTEADASTSDLGDAEGGDVTGGAGDPGDPGDPGGPLPALGPLPAASHWHAAYVIRICDEVLEPLVSDNDPLGIHTHGDGLMHVHPFFEESGYEQATIGLFADAVGLGLSDGELTLPTGGTWRDGDLCEGVPGQVFVDRWQGPLADSPVERIFTDLHDIRFTGDAELYQIAFAPPDSVPVVPPATALLPEVSNLGPAPEPWIEVPDGVTRDQAFFWPVAEITRAPCEEGQLGERSSDGTDRCFDRAGAPISATDSVVSARAVLFNRRPAVELIMADPLRSLISGHFASSSDPFVFAIELDGAVSTVAQLFRDPVGDRLVVTSGFDEPAARAMAGLLDP